MSLYSLIMAVFPGPVSLLSHLLSCPPPPFPLDKFAHQAPQSYQFSQRTAQNRRQQGQRQMPGGCHFFAPGLSGMPAVPIDSALFQPASSESTLWPVPPQRQSPLPSVLSALGGLEASHCSQTPELRAQAGQPAGDHPCQGKAHHEARRDQSQKEPQGFSC